MRPALGKHVRRENLHQFSSPALILHGIETSVKKKKKDVTYRRESESAELSGDVAGVITCETKISTT
jgi:hypothetical protein